MTLLIAGGTGFVGINLLEKALAGGAQIVSLADRPFADRPRHALKRLPGELIEVVGDVRDTPMLRKLMAEHAISRVIHAAVITSSAERERQQGDVIASVNLAGTASLAQAAAEHGVERLLMVGSVSAYGPTVAAEGIIEEDRPQHPQSLYSIGKSASEAIVRRIAELHGMDIRIGRLGTVFGPWEHASGVRDTLSAPHQVVQAARQGRSVRLPRAAVKNWHYSRKAATDLLTLLDAPKPSRIDYNLGSPEVWTLAAWCDALKLQMPDFRYRIGDGPSDQEGVGIELYESQDNALLGGAAFHKEFSQSRIWSMDDSLGDYLDWIDQHQAWGIDPQPA